MGAGVIERVQLRLEMVSKNLTAGINKVRNSLNTVSKTTKEFNNVLGMNLDQFRIANNVTKMSTDQFEKFARKLDPTTLRRFGLQIDEMSGEFTNNHDQLLSVAEAHKQMENSVKSSGGKIGNALRKSTHGLRGFRMEMLGVMFFGMMLQRTFMGLLQPVMDAYGVFDLISVLLLTVFLPIMDLLFPILLNIMEWFINLPDSAKMAIGLLTVLGVIFGTLLMVVGTFALGIGSVIQAFSFLAPALGGLGAGIGVALLPIIAIIAIIIALAYAIWVAWQENFLNIRDFVEMIWTGIQNIFQGAIDIITGIIEIFTGLIEGDLDKVLAGIGKVFGGILKIIQGVLQAILGAIATIIIGIIRMVTGIATILAEIITRIFKWFNDIFGGIPGQMLQWGVDIVKGLIKGILSMAGAVWDAILNLFPPWLRDLIKGATEFVSNVGAGIANFFTGNKEDFIWRAGEGATSINPNDTIIGYKNEPPFSSGKETGSFVQENHFYGFTIDELNRQLDDRDRRVVDEIRRLVKI